MMPKTYVPKSSAKKFEFQSGGSIMRLGFKADELIAFVNQHKNEKGYINLIVGQRLKPSDYGDTHTVYLDEWKPKRGGQPKQEPDDDSPVPF